MKKTTIFALVSSIILASWLSTGIAYASNAFAVLPANFYSLLDDTPSLHLFNTLAGPHPQNTTPKNGYSAEFIITYSTGKDKGTVCSDQNVDFYEQDIWVPLSASSGCDPAQNWTITVKISDEDGGGAFSAAESFTSTTVTVKDISPSTYFKGSLQPTLTVSDLPSSIKSRSGVTPKSANGAITTKGTAVVFPNAS